MKKFIIFLATLFFLAILLATQYKFFLTKYADFFSVNNATKGADAIVVLSGSLLTRLPLAIELSKKGYSSKMLLTDERDMNPALSRFTTNRLKFAREVMKELKADIELEMIPSLKGGATSTFDEAYDVKQYSIDNNLKHLILSTDEFHTRRALYAFKKVFQGTGIKIEIAGAKNAVFNESDWWLSDKGISNYVLEGIKYTIYLITYRNVSFIENY